MIQAYTLASRHAGMNAIRASMQACMQSCMYAVIHPDMQPTMHAYMQADSQAGRQARRQACEHADRQASMHAIRQAGNQPTSRTDQHNITIRFMLNPHLHVIIVAMFGASPVIPYHLQVACNRVCRFKPQSSLQVRPHS